MKKKRRLKIKNLIIVFCLIALINISIIIVNVIFSPKLKLIGTWTTDNITIYEFKKNNTGKLKVSLSEYDFKYKLKKNVLYIDFINDKSEDSKYNYSFKNKKLILKNNNGTFTFTKK